MEFLPQQNKVNQGDKIENQILATGKHVIVIGGGDTGSDCTGTSNRHGCASLTQFELFPTPPDVGKFPRADQRPPNTPWPNWPMILRTSTSHEEGCDRQFSILTKEFLGDDEGRVTGLRTSQIEWTKDDAGRQAFNEVPGTEKIWPAQLVLLAMGFVGPEKNGMLELAGSQARWPRQRRMRRRVSDRACRVFSPPATCVGDSRSWCGRFTKAVRRPEPSTST